MTLDPDNIAIIIALPLIACFTYSIFHFLYYIYHWHKVVSNVNKGYAYFILGPLIFFNIKKHFNDDGQISVIKARHHFLRFLGGILPIIIVMLLIQLIKINGS
jgi:hypothetical protein